MVNATEMAKPFGKQVKHFNENEGTEIFIRSCLNGRNSDLLGLKTRDDLIVSRQNSGTWMHRVLALKFAAWLNPDFEVWVYLTIDNLLFGRHIKRDESFERTVAMQKELEDLRDEPNKTGADFERYLQLQQLLKRETAVRRSLTIEGLCGMKSLF
jgi:hypothetical protein